jgi:hypothetical protein
MASTAGSITTLMGVPSVLRGMDGVEMPAHRATIGPLEQPCVSRITIPAIRVPTSGLLAPIDGLLFDERAHRYSFLGDWLPFSVTGVVSDLDARARKQIERTREGPDGWELRGTSVHRILESHLLGIATDGLQGVIYDDRWAPWAEPLLDHWLFRDCTVLAVEYALCDPLKRVGGCVDFLVRTAQGQTILGDLKTVSTAAALKARKQATAQLGAYASMLCHWWPTITIDRCATLVSAPNECELKVQEPACCIAAWQEAWEKHQAAEMLRGF